VTLRLIVYPRLRDQPLYQIWESSDHAFSSYEPPWSLPPHYVTCVYYKVAIRPSWPRPVHFMQSYSHIEQLADHEIMVWYTKVPIFLSLVSFRGGGIWENAHITRLLGAVNVAHLMKQAVPPPLYAARCSPAPAHIRLTPAAPSAPCSMNIHYRQAAARSGYDYGVVHIKDVLTWTANQSGLVTLTFDLLTLKVVFESRVTWATSVPILVFLGLSVLELGPLYATDVRRQTKASLNASTIRGGRIIN